MNSFSSQAIKDTLHDIQGAITSKVIPAVGTFLGKIVTVISANPLATAAVVAAVIVASLVIFAAYKHYQFHQQLKADVISLNKDLENVSGILNKEKEYFKTEKEILENENADLVNVNVILTREKEYFSEKQILKNEDLVKSKNKVKELKGYLDIADKVRVEMEEEYTSLEKKFNENELKGLTEEEKLVDTIESFAKQIDILEKQLQSK